MNEDFSSIEIIVYEAKRKGSEIIIGIDRAAPSARTGDMAYMLLHGFN